MQVVGWRTDIALPESDKVWTPSGARQKFANNFVPKSVLSVSLIAIVSTRLWPGTFISWCRLYGFDELPDLGSIITKVYK